MEQVLYEHWILLYQVLLVYTIEFFFSKNIRELRVLLHKMHEMDNLVNFFDNFQFNCINSFLVFFVSELDYLCENF